MAAMMSPSLDRRLPTPVANEEKPRVAQIHGEAMDVAVVAVAP